MKMRLKSFAHIELAGIPLVSDSSQDDQIRKCRLGIASESFPINLQAATVLEGLNWNFCLIG